MTCVYWIQVDIFHPLSAVQWEEISGLPSVSNANCVLLDKKLYVGGGYMDVYDSKLYVSSTTFLEWTTLETPMAAKYFALTTYKSQLVLVGGKCMDHIVTNKLWTRNTNNWDPEILPPMQMERYWPSAVNVGSGTEAIVVAGGRGKDGKEMDSVEVLIEEEWSTVQSLPKKCFNTKAIVYNERLYLVGGSRQGRDIYFCKLRSITDKEQLKSKSLWNLFFTKAPSEAAYMASFQHELVAITERDNKMFAYHSFTKYWVHVGDTPPDIRVESFPISLPTGDMIVVGTTKARPKQSKLFLISLNGETYSHSQLD